MKRTYLEQLAYEIKRRGLPLQESAFKLMETEIRNSSPETRRRGGMPADADEAVEEWKRVFENYQYEESQGSD